MFSVETLTDLGPEERLWPSAEWSHRCVRPCRRLSMPTKKGPVLPSVRPTATCTPEGFPGAPGPSRAPPRTILVCAPPEHAARRPGTGRRPAGTDRSQAGPVDYIPLTSELLGDSSKREHIISTQIKGKMSPTKIPKGHRGRLCTFNTRNLFFLFLKLR